MGETCLKKIVKKVLLPIINPGMKRMGYCRVSSTMDSHEKFSLLDSFYEILKNNNFIPNHIVDVGANQGSWTRKSLEHFPDAQITMFEPQVGMKAHVQDVLD